MTAGLCYFDELLVVLYKFRLFCLSMATFHLLLILYYFANLISNEDFVLLYEMFPSKNPNFPYDEYACFDLDNMSEAG